MKYYQNHIVLLSFTENGIDLEAAALLSDEMIEVLIPKLGARLKFKNHWSQYVSSVAS